MKNDLLLKFANVLADLIVKRLGPALKPGPRRNGVRHLDMKCRIAGCKNRSRGPRFLYICLDHEKLPKAKKLAALKAHRATA